MFKEYTKADYVFEDEDGEYISSPDFDYWAVIGQVFFINFLGVILVGVALYV